MCNCDYNHRSHFNPDDQIYIGHCGDSRALLVYSDGATDCLTSIHTPANNLEKTRILMTGGQIYRNEIEKGRKQEKKKSIIGPLRVSPGNLSVTRSIGDKSAKDESHGKAKYSIIPIPEILHIKNNPKEFEMLFIGCDGIFEHLRSEDIGAILRDSIRSTATEDLNSRCGIAINNVIKAAAMSKSSDNLTGVMILLSNDIHTSESEEKKEQFTNILKVNAISRRTVLHDGITNIRYAPPIKGRLPFSIENASAYYTNIKSIYSK